VENNRPLNAVTFRSPAAQPAETSLEIAWIAAHRPRYRRPVHSASTMASML
jgi:hypothetical protein